MDAAADAAKRRWEEAFASLGRAAASGDAGARAQLDVFEKCGLEALLAVPTKQRIHDQSAVFVCPGFAPPAICDWLIERAAPRLRQSTVHDARTGELRTDPRRTALDCGVERDLISAMMQERAARLTGAPVSHHEPPNVISYEPGQKFDHHHDYIDPRQPGAAHELANLGQRVITIVTYLNADFEGAATDFPRLGVSFRGEKGDAIMFSNVLANGEPDLNTWHAGLPVLTGRKWVLSQWIRGRPLPAYAQLFPFCS